MCLFPSTNLPLSSLKATLVLDNELASSQGQRAPLLTKLVKVLVVEVLALPVQVDGVVQRDAVILLRGLRHELSEYADAAVPEDGLREPAHHAPRSRFGVVRFQDVRELKRVIVAAGDIELPAQHGHAAPNVNLRLKHEEAPQLGGGFCPRRQTSSYCKVRGGTALTSCCLPSTSARPRSAEPAPTASVNFPPR